MVASRFRREIFDTLTFRRIIDYCRPSNETRKRHSFSAKEGYNKPTFPTHMHAKRNVDGKSWKQRMQMCQSPPALPRRSLSHPSRRVSNEAQLPRRVTSNGLGKNAEHRFWPRMHIHGCIHAHRAEHSSSYEYFTSVTLTSEPQLDESPRASRNDEEIATCDSDRSISFRRKNQHDLSTNRIYIDVKWI